MSVHAYGRPDLPGVARNFITLPASGKNPPLRMHVTTAGHGPPLLLLHGAPQNHLAWAGLISKFAEHYHVICPDLRGAGWTEAPGHGYDPDSLINDIKALIKAFNLPRVKIVAHDWSAIIAFLLATEHPEMIERLVIISIPDLFVKPDLGALALMRAGWFQLVVPLPFIGPLAIRTGRQTVLRYMHSLTGSRFHGPLPHAELDRHLLREPERARDLSRLYRRTILPTLIGLFIGRYRHRSLRVPTLQLMGAEDPTAALMHMGRYDDRAGDLRYEEIPATAHYVLDEAPEQVYHRTMRFFTDTELSPGQG